MDKSLDSGACRQESSQKGWATCPPQSWSRWTMIMMEMGKLLVVCAPESQVHNSFFLLYTCISYLREGIASGIPKGELKKKMLEGKARIKETDMAEKMQIQAMACASQALDLYDVFDCISIAAHVKKEFDKMYGSGWQCVVGSNFGSFFTHTPGTFIYFALETLNFLIFKGASP